MKSWNDVINETTNNLNTDVIQKIIKILNECNIKYDTTSAHTEGSKYVYYEDDSYSGKRITNEIDEYDYLLQIVDDDSSEQCGGYICAYLYKDGKSYDIGNFCDKWSYTVIDNQVYLIEVNDTFSGDIEYIVFNIKEDDRVVVTSGSITQEVFKQLTTINLRKMLIDLVNKERLI